MFKKILLGILLVTVFGTAGAALAFNLVNNDDVSNVETTEIMTTDDNGEPNSQLMTEGSLGEPWKETGTIIELDDTGFKFQLQNGEIVYVELGPSEYWQNQGVELLAGMPVIVDGTINEGMIHAYQVMLVDGQVLNIRTADGQPLWSGGIDNGQGANAGNGEEGHSGDLNQIDDWVTIEGTLISFQGGNMAMSTVDGEIISFQSGQPRFFASQNVSFQVGDEIVVVGYYENGQLMAGDITQVETGLRVMLRDPNGRPLWAGPGGNGNSNSRGKQG